MQTTHTLSKWEINCLESAILIRDTLGGLLTEESALEAVQIWIDVPGDDEVSLRTKIRMCIEVRDFLNGGPRPKWLHDMHRASEDYACSADGSSIRAIGPGVTIGGYTTQDRSDRACDIRARLMDRLFLSNGGQTSG
jgi:hypothetical protein